MKSFIEVFIGGEYPDGTCTVTPVQGSSDGSDDDIIIFRNQVFTADDIAAKAVDEERAAWVSHMRKIRRELAAIVSGSDSSARVKPIWEIVVRLSALIRAEDEKSGEGEVTS